MTEIPYYPTWTEAEFYKLRDLCQYFTRTADSCKVIRIIYIKLGRFWTKLYQYSQALIITELSHNFWSECYCCSMFEIGESIKIYGIHFNASRYKQEKYENLLVWDKVTERNFSICDFRISWGYIRMMWCLHWKWNVKCEANFDTKNNISSLVKYNFGWSCFDINPQI